jgi:hypothetical protein
MSIERIEIENKPELEKIIMTNLGHIEKGLTVICNDVPINEKTTLDILCHDDKGQLVIIQISVNEDDDMLLYGLQSLNYVNKFKSMLKMTYAKHKIDDRENPRLILIAPSFSETVYNAVKNMQGMRIDLYEWEYLKIGDQKGLRIQPIFTSPRAWKRKAEHGDKPKSRERLETKKKPEHPPQPKPLKPSEPKLEPQPKSSEKKEESESSSHPKTPVEPKEKPREASKKEPKKKLKLF